MVAVLGAIPPSGLAHDAAASGVTAKRRVVCRVPSLKGMVVREARERAAKAGCSVRMLGAHVELPEIQTIRAQSPRAGKHGRSVTLWVNRLCPEHEEPREPRLTPGPTELVSGLFLSGGPAPRPRSGPVCKPYVRTSGAGTITVREPGTGSIVAAETVAKEHLATIPLAPGRYTIEGTFDDATIDGHLGQSFPATVQIPPGETVRQDVWLSIP